MTAPAPVLFRQAQADDLVRISEIEARAHAYPWPDSTLHWAIAQSSVLAHVAMRTDDIIGYALIEPILDEATLLNITIEPALQHQGLGRLLLHHAVAQLPAHIHRIILEVRESNLPAQRLYQAFGFTVIATRRQYYPIVNGREDALIMEYWRR